jgi:hypothetical protein
MSKMILARLAESVGAGLVVELEFRVAPAKRGPQRAERVSPDVSQDEADRIEDPGMRRLYIQSRKRELA